MPTLTESIRDLLIRDLSAFEREIQAFPDDQTLWRTVPGLANSAGNLALHVSGNLRHFLGAVLAGDGYRRDRDLEFSRRTGSREEVVSELAAALQTVDTVLAELPEAALIRAFPMEVQGQRDPAGTVLLRLSLHLSYHLGQANYLRRVLAAG